jgi:hypothetical protein
VNEKLKFFIAGVAALKVFQALWIRFYGWWSMRRIVKELAGSAFGDPGLYDFTLPVDMTDAVLGLLSNEQWTKLRSSLNPNQLEIFGEYLGHREKRLATKKVREEVT